MRVKIISDSTCDLSPELLERYDIAITPLCVIKDGKEFHDGVDITPADIFAHVDGVGSLCSTAAVSQYEYGKVFARYAKEYDAVVQVTIGANFSCCYQNACLAAQEFDNVYVVDSENLSSGQGLLVVAAAKLAARWYGEPAGRMTVVGVTGTNGKGSTCAMLASMLQKAGYKTGLYTSPYIVRFNERIQINGVQISDADICRITEQIKPLADSIFEQPTEFEMVTALGFEYFARHNCDLVVCEVGMGGEFDATNVILPPEAAIICNIGLDHTEVLGDTLEKIAEKLGYKNHSGVLKRIRKIGQAYEAYTGVDYGFEGGKITG